MAWAEESELLEVALSLADTDGLHALIIDGELSRNLSDAFAADRDVFSLLQDEGSHLRTATTSTVTSSIAVVKEGDQPDRKIIKTEPSEPLKPAATANKKRTNRKREEILFLRSTVDELEDRLLKLKERQERYEDSLENDDDDGRRSREMAAVWENIANRQFEQRRQAELENSRLRMMLEEQIRVAKTLERVMRKRSRSIDLIQPQQSGDFKRIRSSEGSMLEDAQVIDNLANGLVAMYAEVNLILADRRFSLSPPFRDISLRNDATLGTGVETCDGCILPFAFDRVAAVIWGQYGKKSTPPPHHINRQKDERDEHTVTAEFEGEIRVPHVQSAYRGKIAVRRFVEANRVVIVWDVLIQMLRILGSPVNSMLMRHKKWQVIEPIPDRYASSAPATFVRSYQLATPEVDDQAESELTSSEREKQVGLLSTFVLRSMEFHLDTSHTALENMLLEDSLL